MSNDVKWNAVLQSGEWWDELDLPEREKLQLNWVIMTNQDSDLDEMPPILWLPLEDAPDFFKGWILGQTMRQ